MLTLTIGTEKNQ